MIELKSASEIEKMRRPARVVAEILTALREMVRPGTTTADLDRAAERMITRAGARSAFKNYRVGTVVFLGPVLEGANIIRAASLTRGSCRASVRGCAQT